MFSELIKSTSFWIVMSVIVGFLLGEVHRWIREKLRIEKLKSMIEEELKSIRNQVIRKKEIIEPKLNQLEKTDSVTDPFNDFRDVFINIINVGYNNYFPELYERFLIPERNHIHTIYERLDLTERTIYELEKASFDEHKIISILRKYKSKFKAILNSYNTIL